MGDGKFFRGPRFLNEVFFGKISIFIAKISDDLFLVIDQVFRIFPFFSQIFRIFTMLNVIYDPFLKRKTTISGKNSFMSPFFTLFELSRASDNTASKNIVGWGRMHGPFPHLKFLGDRLLSLPVGLRPCCLVLDYRAP